MLHFLCNNGFRVGMLEVNYLKLYTHYVVTSSNTVCSYYGKWGGGRLPQGPMLKRH